ncbi:disease resistance protein RUN1-like [Prosopis cineraria]|uniref:disease resistance protein RUN1-like n=1 Tax=Prosopis cineraria TaxID=364024 RepID=UPI002410416E|nr:disease resistance protein RUN1-like [Prosopis cineraria]
MDANVEAAYCSSSMSSRIPPWKYHVFLSFRGEDTRKGFTAHLYAALQHKSIITFIDNELRRGDVISFQLLQAIEDSLISIVILSQNYASSSWCLDELQKVLESRESLGREVFPVFYNVDPSDVRHQRGAFAYAFQKHNERFREEGKVQRWRNTLKDVANLAGYHSNDQLETKFIEEIVAGVWTKLQRILPCHKINKFVGMESKIKEVDSILKIGLNDIRLLGIWGMGGIGKTSLARFIYETNYNQFDLCYFLANVKDVCEKEGLVPLQRKFLSHNRKLKGIEFNDAYDGMKKMISVLCNQKVLIVLDDVSDMSQLEYLAIKQTWLGPGSRVIVTTRNMQLLKTHGEFDMYEAKLLNDEESLQLFCQKAFKRDKPIEDYIELSGSVVKFAAGLPLTLEVLGCYLYGESILEWKDALEKIKEVPPNDILKKLQISYDALDHLEKKIFLDIACFFKGMQKDKVIHVLDICGFHPIIGIRKLVEKCLLFEYQDYHNKWYLGMHDMVQEMGKSIVSEESPSDASRRSRLWSIEDIIHVLTKNKGTSLIEIIHLESLSKQLETRWGPEVFLMMYNLRILSIKSCDVCLPLGLECFSSSLKILDWEKYPLKSLPLGVQPNELVQIKMHNSKITKLWNETQMSGKLKIIDLSHSKDLIQTPNFSLLPNLEQLALKGCTKLVEVHPSLGHHKKIIEVNLEGCKNLKTLPCRLEMVSLRKLVLSSCYKFKRLPEFGENMKNLLILKLKDCQNLLCLPSTIDNLKSLKTLDISGCTKFSSLPENLDEIGSIEELDVSKSSVKEIPSSILGLKCLKKLNANGCNGIVLDSSLSLLSPILRVFGFNSYKAPLRLTLPPSFSGLSSLRELKLRNCNLSVRSIPNDLGCLPSLECLDLSENDFSNLPSGSYVLPPSFSSLSSLRSLCLANCNLYDGSIPNDLSPLSSLEVLYLSGNNFTNLPSTFISKLQALRDLYLVDCKRLLSLPDVPPNIEFLDAVCCHPSMRILSSPYLLCRFLLSSYNNKVQDSRPWFFAPGSEIPPWFYNQDFDFLDDEKSCISIKVDTSHFYGSSESYRIFVCVVIQNVAPKRPMNLKGYFSILCNSIGFGLHDSEAKNPHLYFSVVPPSYVKNAFNNQVEIQFQTTWESSLANDRSEKVELIRKCGWRVASKEEIEECMQHQMP